MAYVNELLGGGRIYKPMHVHKHHFLNTHIGRGILIYTLNRVPWKTFYLLGVEWGGRCKYNIIIKYLSNYFIVYVKQQQYKRKGKNPFICLSIFRFWPNTKITKIAKNHFNIYLIKFLFIFLFFIFFIFILFSILSISYLIRYFLYCHNRQICYIYYHI